MICGFAEILKHALIKDEKFFNWLEKIKYLLSKDFNKFLMQLRKVVELKYFLLIKIR